MISIRNSKDEKILGDYAIVKHCGVPVALIIQAFERVTNSYRLYFSSYNHGYCMREIVGTPTIPCAKTDGKWYGYNLYKEIKTRNTPNRVLQLIPNQEITIEEYSSITHPLKAYLSYEWINPSTKNSEIHYVFLSDIKKDDSEELKSIMDNYQLEYCNNEAVKDFIINSRLSVQEYFKGHEDKETPECVSYLSYNGDYLVHDFKHETFIWYSPDGILLEYSSKFEFACLSSKKGIKVRRNTDLKTLFDEMEETIKEEAELHERRQGFKKRRREKKIYRV